MPQYGAQHESYSAMSYGNFGARPQQPTNGWSAEETAALQSRLTTRLGPEYLSTRPGPGGQKVCYLTGPTVIGLANEVFGFNGWSSSIQNISIDEMTQNPNTGKFSVGISVIVRATLKDGTYHEDLGYGHCDNMKDRYQAFEKARKEGVTDGLKRALRTFGNVLGNGLYEKDYQDALKRTKTQRVKLDGNTFKRMEDPRDGLASRTASINQPLPPAPEPIDKREPEIAPAPLPAPAAAPRTAPNQNQNNAPSAPQFPQIQNGDVDDVMDIELDDDAEFGSDLFEEAADFGDPLMTVGADEEDTSGHKPSKQAQQQNVPGPRTQPKPHPLHPSGSTNQFITPSKPPTNLRNPGRGPIPPRLHQENSMTRGSSPQSLYRQVLTQRSGPPKRPIDANSEQPPAVKSTTAPSDLPPPLPGDQVARSEGVANDKEPPTVPDEIPEDKRPQDPAGGFYSARAADILQKNPYAAPKAAPPFDPRFDSPSIRKTAGFDHNTSAPVSRETYKVIKPNVQGPKLSQTANPSPAPRRSVPPAGGFGGAGGRPPLTTSYKPPTRRPLPRSDSVASTTVSGQAGGADSNIHGKRPPLYDKTNNGKQANGLVDDPAKRARLDEGAKIEDHNRMNGHMP